MNKPHDLKNTEGNFFARLINVLYGVGWLGVLIVTVLVFIIQKPYQYVNNDKSYITCLNDGKKYTYSSINNHLDTIPNRYQLNLLSIENKAKYICETSIENNLSYSDKKEWVWSEQDQDWFSNTPENREILVQNVKNKSNQEIYKINNIYSTRGSWGSTIIWVTGIFIVLSITLDFLKATLFYLFTGKKISIINFNTVKLLKYLNSK